MMLLSFRITLVADALQASTSLSSSRSWEKISLKTKTAVITIYPSNVANYSRGSGSSMS